MSVIVELPELQNDPLLSYLYARQYEGRGSYEDDLLLLQDNTHWTSNPWDMDLLFDDQIDSLCEHRLLDEIAADELSRMSPKPFRSSYLLLQSNEENLKTEKSEKALRVPGELPRMKIKEKVKVENDKTAKLKKEKKRQEQIPPKIKKERVGSSPQKRPRTVGKSAPPAPPKPVIKDHSDTEDEHSSGSDDDKEIAKTNPDIDETIEEEQPRAFASIEISRVIFGGKRSRPASIAARSGSDCEQENDQVVHIVHARGTQTAVKSSKCKGPGPSSKMSSRIFAFHTLFSRDLPENRPEFLSEGEWNELVDASATSKLVTILEFRDNRVSVRLPIAFDIIIHSLANYGPSLKEHTELASTRFRWWTDSSIRQLKVLNRNANNDTVERTIQLPESLVAHPYLQQLFHNDRTNKLCSELIIFFGELLKLFLHPDDYFNFSQGAFGRSRKRPRNPIDCETAIDNVVEVLSKKWDSKLAKHPH